MDFSLLNLIKEMINKNEDFIDSDKNYLSKVEHCFLMVENMRFN